MFDKSYHDSINNEKSSHSIIVFNVHSMLRDTEYGIGLSLHILYYGFVKVPYYMFISFHITSNLEEVAES